MRTGQAQAYITNLGNNPILRAYAGANPGGVLPITGANTLQATFTATGVLGVAAPAGVDVTETNFANVAANNVGGLTTTFMDVCSSAGVVRSRIKIPADGITVAPAITTGQPASLSGLTIPVGNA